MDSKIFISIIGPVGLCFFFDVLICLSGGV